MVQIHLAAELMGFYHTIAQMRGGRDNSGDQGFALGRTQLLRIPQKRQRWGSRDDDANRDQRSRQRAPSDFVHPDQHRTVGKGQAVKLPAFAKVLECQRHRFAESLKIGFRGALV
jgi:hypothetical protein